MPVSLTSQGRSKQPHEYSAISTHASSSPSYNALHLNYYQSETSSVTGTRHVPPILPNDDEAHKQIQYKDKKQGIFVY